MRINKASILLSLIFILLSYVFFRFLTYILIDTSNEDDNVDNTVKCSNTTRRARYSSFACSGTMNYEREWNVRTCRFHNICYDPTTNQFEYFASPDRPLRPILFDPHKGHIYSFKTEKHGFVNLVARASADESWAPIIVQRAIPSDAVFLKPSVHVLFMHWHLGFDRFDPGHLIWEDVASTYMSMVRMRAYDRQAVLMEYLNFPPINTPHYRMYDALVPAFADRVVPLHKYLTDYRCFHTLVAGGSVPSFGLETEEYNNGKEVMNYNFRSLILRHHKIDLSQPPTTHHILLVNKTSALRKSKRTIHNLDEVATFLKETYSPAIPITIVEWHKLPTFTEQLKLTYSATILITPCGGVSSMIPFLPRNAHAIIMDYYVNAGAYDKENKWELGESASMDAAIWNYFPHVRKLYYQVRSEKDYVFDFSEGKNARNDASIIVNMTRLKELVDTAIENSI